MVHTWNSSPLRSNLLQLQCACCTVPTTSGMPHRCPLVWACQWPSSQPVFFLLNCLITTGSELREWPKCHREQSIDYRDAEELSWCTSWSNSDEDGVLASTDWISSWTPLKPQHSNPNPNPLANQLWCIDFLTPHTPLIIPHRLSGFLASLMPLKNWCSIYARWLKSSLKHSIRFFGIFYKFKSEFYCISFF